LRQCKCPPKPGPGQDVEEQARALAAKVIAKLHIGQHLHGDWPPLQRIADGILPEIEQALRAAQAEAERRAQEAEARLAEREKE
jgi:hypothetical protein